MGILEVVTNSNRRFLSESSSNRQQTQINIANRLQKLLKTNEGYQFNQQNGQRAFEPCPALKMVPPPKGCEIFVGNIPKQIYEDVLVPLFQEVGKIYKFRLMLDFNQRTRGYAFVTYFNPQHVNEAIKKFHNYEIQGLALAVYKSIDNRRLFVGNIPKTKTREEVSQVFNCYVEGIVDIIMYSSWQAKDLNRGFAFLEFETHMQASVARRQLHPRNLVVWNQPLYVDWADPVPDVSPSVMAQVSVLYIKNLPLYFSSTILHKAFQMIVGTSAIKRTHKILTFAFVHCKNRKSAEIVKSKLTGLALDDQEIEIEWARPREYSTQWRALHPPENFCLSVPLRTRRLIKKWGEQRKAMNSAASETGSSPASSYS